MAKSENTMVADSLFDFSKGMNSGVDPFILPADQIAYARNCTVRGNFIRNRSAYQIQAIESAIWDTIKSVGLFQGACYFAPDSGPQGIIAQIGGRIFTFTPDSISSSVSVSEVTIPGDPNLSGAPQAFLLQAERWVIIQNGGLNNPIFYDTSTQTSRRSIPTSNLQATSDIASKPYTPDIGKSITLALTAPYVGPVNQSIQVVEYDANDIASSTTTYEVIAVGGSATTYNVTLKNLGDIAGTSQIAGSQLIIQPSNIGNITAIPASSNGPPPTFTATMSSALPAFAAVGDIVSIQGISTWKIKTIQNSRTKITYEWTGAGNPFPDPGLVGQPVYDISNGQVNQVIGALSATFIAPATGATVDTTLADAYTGAINQVVYINGAQYQVVAYNPIFSAGNNTVTLKNLNDSRSGHQFNTTGYPTEIWNFPELPAGRQMAYCQGRVSVASVDGLSFIIGDIVGGSSGTPDYKFRDAVLKVSENELLSNGGAFNVPSNLGQITAMITTAQLDASLGQGALMIVTPGGIFSCNAPTDRTTWASLKTPIVSESLIGLGGLSQNSTVVVNGDLIFRAVDGIRSLIMAKREFYSWGNTPISEEMNRVLNGDDVSLLNYASSVQFDNRLLMTSSPTQGNQGVYFTGLIALNFDPVSSIQGKSASVYDGVWDGLNVLQIIDGQFSGVDRCFAFVYDAENGIEIHEILKSTQGNLDNGTDPITWSFESPILFKSSKGKSYYELCAIEDGEFYVSDASEELSFAADYRPDFSDNWYPWHSFNYDKSYGVRLGLGKPRTGGSNGVNATSTNFGRWFQVRFTMVGSCVFKGMLTTASLQPQTAYAKVLPSNK